MLRADFIRLSFPGRKRIQIDQPDLASVEHLNVIHVLVDLVDL